MYLKQRALIHPDPADIGMLNREKKFQCILVIWGKFYEDIQGWQVNFELPGSVA
jgi:hypothetical protein